MGLIARYLKIPFCEPGYPTGWLRRKSEQHYA